MELNISICFLGTKDDNHRGNSLTCVNGQNGLYSSEIIQSNFDYDDFNCRKWNFTTKDGYFLHQRIVFARHRFHGNIKQTLTRWMRETPV